MEHQACSKAVSSGYVLHVLQAVNHLVQHTCTKACLAYETSMMITWCSCHAPSKGHLSDAILHHAILDHAISDHAQDYVHVTMRGLAKHLTGHA